MMLPLNDIFIKYGVKPNGVLHIGASEGQEREFYKELGVKKVIWIEAIPDVFKKLKENLVPYPNQIAMNCCLSNSDNEEVEFNISNNQAQSSSLLELMVHKEIHPEVSYIDKIKLTTWTADRLFSVMDIDISMLDFLNIDVQGAELMVLEGMEKLIKQFKSVNIEINIRETYKGCALLEDVDYWFFLHDFERVETGQFVQDTWTDAFYLHKSLL